MGNNLIVNGLSTFFGNVVFKNQVEFDNTIKVNTDTAREITIAKGKDKVSVVFTQPYSTPPIVSISLLIDDPTLEAKILSAGYDYAIVNKTTTGFDIRLNKVAQDNLKFNWVAVETQ